MLLAKYEQEEVEGVDNKVGVETQEEIILDFWDSGVSLHALSGKSSPDAFRIKGLVRKRTISVLIIRVATIPS